MNISKIKSEVSTCQKTMYEIRDALNSYLSYIDVPDDAFMSGDEKLSPATVHNYILKSSRNFEKHKRSQSIEKANMLPSSYQKNWK